MPSTYPIPASVLMRAIDIYLQTAYPSGTIPPAAASRVEPIKSLAPETLVPDDLFETVNLEPKILALRLGQPIYPHMKLVVEPTPDGQWLFRADAHDSHLHAPAGSPDAAPLAMLRSVNKELTEKIEAAWTAANLPTFKQYLRAQLAKRKGN